MRHILFCSYLLGKLLEMSLKDVVVRESLGVIRFEIFFANHAALVYVEKSGIRHAFGHSLRFRVKHLEAANDFGLRVSQERKVYAMPLGEIFQDSRTIIADCRQRKSLRLKSLLCRLQLAELRLAEGSAVGGAEEQDDGALRSFERLVGVFVAELITQSKCRRLLTDLQADRRSQGVIRGRVFLTARNSRQSSQEKNDNPNFHLCSGPVCPTRLPFWRN